MCEKIVSFSKAMKIIDEIKDDNSYEEGIRNICQVIKKVRSEQVGTLNKR